MSKKQLSSIVKVGNQFVKKMNRDTALGLKASNFGFTSGEINQVDQKLFMDAVKNNDLVKVKELYLKFNLGLNEVYYNMPDLFISNNKSVRNLKIKIYASKQKDDRILHKLFSRTRID